MQNAAAIERPWEKSWFYVDAGQRPVAFHIVMIHVLAVVGFVLYPIPPLPVALFALALATMGGLGTTVAYHRSLSHRSVKLHPAVEQFLIFWAVFNGSGAPRQWVANHRRHHATADTDDDISSPRHGFWWSHIRWLYQVRDSDPNKWNRDMDKPRYNIWTTLLIPTIVISATCGIVFGWPGLFWAGPIRMMYSLHGQCLVNSLTHMGPVAKEGDDSSINVWWLGPFQLAAWGENWHRNHHSEAISARFARAWYQIDVGWYVICGLQALGLATDVRREKAAAAVPVLAVSTAPEA